MKKPFTATKHRARGFQRASGLVQPRIREASEKRGFAISRLLTHWAEVVGPEFADMTRPVDISYGRGGFGAILTVLTTGAQAPMLQMQDAKLKARVNACYGYNAISRIRITQTAPTGFAEGKASFDHKPKKQPTPETFSPATQRVARTLVTDVTDTDLQQALERLAGNVITKRTR
jgi:hypothetical protein